MADKQETDKDEKIQKQENEIATLKNELKKSEDPNAGPRVISRGRESHPRYQRSKEKVPAVLPKEEKPKNPKK